MSRLLFAAARGARIQMKNRFGTWVDVQTLAHGHNTFYDYRIHPEDEALQYGPISTALREMALTDDCEEADILYCRVEIEREDGYWNSTEEQRCVFLLFLAEALADEGL